MINQFSLETTTTTATLEEASISIEAKTNEFEINYRYYILLYTVNTNIKDEYDFLHYFNTRKNY